MLNLKLRNNVEEALLQLVRLGIKTGTVYGSGLTLNGSDSIDWYAVKELADEQGLSAVVLDGIERLPERQRPPQIFLLEWIGETLQEYEYRYNQYRQAIAELAGFYNSRGFKMMVLKGYACGIDWPRPEHRPYGDIDIWQFGQQKEADASLAKEKGIEIDSSHHHHTVFYWGEFMVENHYDFVNVHDYKSSVSIEKIFKELGEEDSNFVEVDGNKVYLPSANLHALFLIRHLIAHFTSTSVTLRQLLDWAFFVEKHTHEIDWKWFHEILNKYHMNDFFNCINAICIEELGFSADIFHDVQFNPNFKDRILRDLLNPEFEVKAPQHLIPRLLYKYKRWKGNSWKRRLCYNESDWSAFWSGIWAHLLKPASI